MARIYFDTNVFSNLLSNKVDKFRELNKLLESHKNKLSFYFSYAHIRDKRKDLTEFKFKDFAFMETFVGDNYLAYHPIKKQTSFYIATPLMVFNDNQEDDFNILNDFWEDKDDDGEGIKLMKETIKHLYSSIPFQRPSNQEVELSEGYKKLMAKILPYEKDNPTLYDLMKNMSEFTRKIFSDSDLYKELRTMIDIGLNNGTITLDNNFDFNEALKNTAIKKTFIEFVKDSVNVSDKNQIPYYDFYNIAYNMLDIFGISKDTITAKNNFHNLHVDGMHSYFARYCDFFITDDKTTKIKSEALYKLFDIDTKVLNVEQFVQLFMETIDDYDYDEDLFMEKIIYDLKNADRSKFSFLGNEVTYRLNQNHKYLGFFDAVLEIRGNSTQKLVILKSDTNLLSEPSYYETSQIINRALNVFGEDTDSRKDFDYHLNRNISSVLMERKWEFKLLTIELRKYDPMNKYALIITHK